MDYINAIELITYMRERSGKGLWTLSKSMGNKGQFLDTQRRRGSTLGLSKAAQLINTCNCSLVIVDKSTGESIAEISPNGPSTPSS